MKTKMEMFILDVGRLQTYWYALGMPCIHGFAAERRIHLCLCTISSTLDTERTIAVFVPLYEWYTRVSCLFVFL